MRKFNLYFDDIKYTLNGENNVWFTNPAGLGADYSPAMVDLRNGFFKPITTDIIPQNPIVGDITFTRVTDVLPYGDAYALYRNFVTFAAQSQKIEFAYQPYGADEFRCEVKLEYITKTEKSGNWLTCTISFQPLTPWYLPVDVEVELIEDEDTGGFLTSVTPLGDIPAAMEIELLNGGTPWLISVATATENLGSIGITGAREINQAGTVRYSSRYNDSYVTYQQNGSDDVIDLISLEPPSPGINPVAHLKPFETNYIAVFYQPENVKPTSAKVKLYYYYRSV